MKKLFLLTICTIVWAASSAQKSSESSNTEGLTKVQVRLSTGSNNFTSLFGLGLNARIKDGLFGTVGVGLGGWGFKSAIGLKYEMRNTSGWSYNLAFSNSGGAKNVQIEVDNNSSTSQKVAVDLKAAQAVNLSAAYNWVFRKRHAFFLEFGYAVPLKDKPWVVQNGSSLSSTTELALKWLQPGGLILNLGVNLGF